jgi:hypothetical protein
VIEQNVVCCQSICFLLQRLSERGGIDARISLQPFDLGTVRVTAKALAMG